MTDTLCPFCGSAVPHSCDLLDETGGVCPWEESDNGDMKAETLIHIMPKADECKHEFEGWRDFEDGRGGEAICKKCGIGAMAYSLRCDI